MKEQYFSQLPNFYRGKNVVKVPIGNKDVFYFIFHINTNFDVFKAKVYLIISQIYYTQLLFPMVRNNFLFKLSYMCRRHITATVLVYSLLFPVIAPILTLFSLMLKKRYIIFMNKMFKYFYYPLYYTKNLEVVLAKAFKDAVEEAKKEGYLV
jgi:hypothetical protein